MYNTIPMSNFEFYDERYVPAGFGFRNLGSTCYFNAMIQALVSCSAFNKLIIENRDVAEYKNNKVIEYYTQMMALSLQNADNQQLPGASPHIWGEIFKYIKSRSDGHAFGTGQQDAAEGFHMFMEAIEEFQPLQDLFKHRYETVVYCPDCKQDVSNTLCEYIIFDVQPNLKIEQLEKFQELDPSFGQTLDLKEFLQQQNTHVDKDYRCPKCKVKSEKFMKIKLRMLPEILVVLSKKYVQDEKGRARKLNTVTQFPKTLEFNGAADGKRFKIKYDAVAQIEHSGSLKSGHYWAVCKRKGKWQNLNDSSVRDGEFMPTKNTYITFYHVVQ